MSPALPSLRIALCQSEGVPKDVAANLDLALTGGEDYELALFVPPAKKRAFESACARRGEKLALIGEATRTGRLKILNAPHLRSWGFDHFGGARRAR